MIYSKDLQIVSVRGPKIIDHVEILRRARSDIQRELEALEARVEAESLPRACYVDERQALGAKLSAIKTMLYYECGQYE